MILVDLPLWPIYLIHKLKVDWEIIIEDKFRVLIDERRFIDRWTKLKENS